MSALSQILGARRAGWHPTDFGRDRLREWHDADFATRSAEDGTGTVSAFVGLARGLNPAQATAANRPLWYPPGFIDRRSLVWFDGTDDFLRTTTITGLVTGANPCWLAGSGVQASLATSGLRRFVTYGSSANWCSFGCDPNPFADNNPTFLQDAAFTLAGPFAYVAAFTATTLTMWVMGRDAVTTALTLNTGTTALTFGAGINGTNGYFRGGLRNQFEGAGTITDSEAQRFIDWMLKDMS